MSEPLRWHGHEITENESMWFFDVHDLLNYCVKLRDNTPGLGVPDTVPIEIRDEMKIMLETIGRYPDDTDLS